MKRLLLAGICAASLAAQARAQVIVFDPHSAANQIQELARWAQQLNSMVQQVHQLEATYYALSHISSLAGAVQALGMLGIQNPLPVNPYAVQGLLNGTGGPGGMLGSIGSLYNGSMTTNRVYTVPGDSWVAQELNRNGNGIAGAQSLSLQLYQSAAQRAPLLSQLQSLLMVAQDPSDREALIGRIGAEQSYIQNQQMQAMAIGNYMQAQFASRDQREHERFQQDIDEVLADAKARGYWNGN